MTNIEKFREAYLVTLARAVEKHPDEYAYGLDRVAECVEKMLPALASGSANVEGAAKAAARKLGIRATIRGIRDFLSEEVTP